MLKYRVTRVGLGTEYIFSYMRAISVFLDQVEHSNSTDVILEEVQEDDSVEVSARVLMTCTTDERGNKIISRQ